MRSILRVNSVKRVLNSVKTGTKPVLNSVKRVLEPVKTQSNGRVNPTCSINQPGTRKTGCVLLPLGSPTGCSKRSYVHVPGVPAAVVTRGVTLLSGSWVLA